MPASLLFGHVFMKPPGELLANHLSEDKTMSLSGEAVWVSSYFLSRFDVKVNYIGRKVITHSAVSTLIFSAPPLRALPLRSECF